MIVHFIFKEDTTSIKAVIKKHDEAHTTNAYIIRAKGKTYTCKQFSADEIGLYGKFDTFDNKDSVVVGSSMNTLYEEIDNIYKSQRWLGNRLHGLLRTLEQQCGIDRYEITVREASEVITYDSLGRGWGPKRIEQLKTFFAYYALTILDKE